MNLKKMKINILLPYREKFDLNYASAVSITVKNNLEYSHYKNVITVFGQSVENPISKKNFCGIKFSKSFLNLFRSKNFFLAEEMIKIILNDSNHKQLIEVHNRPYIIDKISSKLPNCPVSLFFHNNPKEMRGSKSVKERNNLLKKCASVFCVSEFIRKQFVDGLSNKLEKVHVLYNGIQRSIAKLPRKEKDILFVGRLTKDKGVHIYVDIAKKISKQYPNWTFSLIGSSETRDLKNPNSFSSQNIEKFKSIGNQAYYYGFQNQDFVHAKMLKSSIILIPSFHEAFSLVAAEAMSNGIAIIASNVGGMAEIINKNGILINDINKLSFEKALLKLLDDDIVRKKFQNEAWKNFHYFADKSSRNLDKHRKLIYNRFFNFSSNLDTEK